MRVVGPAVVALAGELLGVGELVPRARRLPEALEAVGELQRRADAQGERLGLRETGACVGGAAVIAKRPPFVQERLGAPRRVRGVSPGRGGQGRGPQARGDGKERAAGATGGGMGVVVTKRRPVCRKPLWTAIEGPSSGQHVTEGS